MAKKIDAGSIAYFEGKYVPIEDAKVSILTHSFNYGTALFEGIRGYFRKEDNTILIFRLKDHVDRLVRNFRILCMDVPETRDDIAMV